MSDDAIRVWNIDVDAKAFSIFSDDLKRGLQDGDDLQGTPDTNSGSGQRGVMHFLFHRRKEATGGAAMKPILQKVRDVTSHMAANREKIECVYLVDCGLGAEEYTSELSVLADIMDVLSDTLGSDVPADVLLMAGQTHKNSGGGYAIKDITTRNLKDPSVVRDQAVKAFEICRALGLEFDFEKLTSNEEELKQLFERAMKGLT